jgi:sugar-specific transcriptional regulator TrmB
VIRVLINLGLSQREAEVYVFLAKAGPQKARNIADALKIQRQQLHQSLKSLRHRGIVNATVERSIEFSAIPFDRVLELLKQATLNEAQRIEQNKEEILSIWQSVIMGDLMGSG